MKINRINSYILKDFCSFSIITVLFELSVDLRRDNTEPSVDFRKSNTEPSVHFRRAKTETY